LTPELVQGGARAPELPARLVTAGVPTLAAAVEELDAQAATLAALLHARRVRPRLWHLVVPPLAASGRALVARGPAGEFWGRLPPGRARRSPGPRNVPRAPAAAGARARADRRGAAAGGGRRRGAGRARRGRARVSRGAGDGRGARGRDPARGAPRGARWRGTA